MEAGTEDREVLLRAIPSPWSRPQSSLQNSAYREIEVPVKLQACLAILNARKTRYSQYTPFPDLQFKTSPSTPRVAGNSSQNRAWQAAVAGALRDANMGHAVVRPSTL